MKKKIGFELLKIFILTILAAFLTLFSLYYSVVNVPTEIFASYFSNPLIAILNFIPVLLIMLFFYCLTRKMSLSFFITCLIDLSLTIVNYLKLALRSDPLLMEDFQYLKEALNIQKNYVLNFRKGMYITVIFCIIVVILLFIIFDKKNKSNEENKEKNKKGRIFLRIISPLIIVIISIVCLKNLYFSSAIYEKTSNTEYINIWSGTQQYISRGLIYSFLHSYTSISNEEPDYYNKEIAISTLNNYSYANIEEDKKVNIIGIMLEAYNDFSKFDSIEFEKNPYILLDKIREESYYGELCTNIFAGGTVSTERSFITGYTSCPSFRKKSNSFARYFYEQGYTVEGSHPCYQWFYNRLNTNENLGFSSYYFFENKYSALANGTIAPDNILFKEILNLYNQNSITGKPYFSFNVTYQNHGPYSDGKIYSDTYLKAKQNYTQDGINIFNNYLHGIEDTTNQIYDMINELRNNPEPTVLIIFGDHNPWLGDSNSVYSMLGINLNLDTEDGFYNYYCTPYIIWANDSAKETLDNNFIGKGPTISPCFLMSEFFDLAGYTGNEFMQINTNLKNTLPIVHFSGRYVENSLLTNKLSQSAMEKLKTYINAQYYWSTNFKK